MILASQKEIQEYLNLKSGKQLHERLESQQKSGIITDDILKRIEGIKAFEYSRFLDPKNVWKDVKTFLTEFPEIFDITDIMLIPEPTRKFIMVSNSNSIDLIEDIFKYKTLSFQRFDKTLNEKNISFFIISQSITKKIWHEEPFGDIFHMAEQSGIRVGLYFYENKDYSLALIRSLNIDIEKTGDYGDLSRGKGGLRKDLEIGFKSSWEANFARILNYHGYSWEYELAKNCFNVDIKTGSTYYHPDFKVFRNSNEYFWVEIKGFWDQDSLSKVSSFRTKYPNEKLVIVDGDLYFSLQERYESILPNWENEKIPKKSEIVSVVGINFNNRHDTILTLISGESLQLIREKVNKYDSNAVKVLNAKGNEIGYLCKEWAAIYAFKLDIGMIFTVTFERKELETKTLKIKIALKDFSFNNLEDIV